MKMRKQRLMGLALIAIAALVVALASTGETVEDRDATAAVMIGPLGLYMMFTKEYVLYDGEPAEPEEKARDRPGPTRRGSSSSKRTTTKGVNTWHGKELSSPRASRHGRTPTTPSGRSPRRNSPSPTSRAR